MLYEKVYVAVITKFFSEGGMRPLQIIWLDGRKYDVDKVKFIERAPSKVGGFLTKRYTVVINGFERQLFYEKEIERWFIERKIR